MYNDLIFAVMKKLISFWSLFTIVMVAMLSLSISFVSCSKDEIEEDDFEPTQNVSNQDPEGTIVLNMTSGADNNYYKLGDLGQIHIDVANNFRGWTKDNNYKIEFVTIGKVDGLSSVNRIPLSGWAESAAVVPGTGYMMRYTPTYGGDIQYARIYVIDYLTTATTDEFGMTTGSNSGATIKYQAPLHQSIKLDNKSITFPNMGGRQCIKLEYPTHLVIKNKPSWCNVQLYMDSVVVNVGSNADSLRSGTIILNNVTGEATISVAQGAVEAISLEKMSLSFSNKASSQTIKLKAPTYYMIDTIPNWCNAQVFMDSIRISVQENKSTKRAGEIILKNAISKATISVSQSAITAIKLEKDSLAFTNKESSQTIKLKDPTDYEIDSIPNWCSAEIYMDSIRISVQENFSTSRSGNIVLKNAISKATIVVSQNAITTIRLEKTSLNFSHKSSSQTVKLKEPTQYKVYKKPDWCSTKVYMDSVVVFVQENSGTERTGDLVLINDASKAVLKISQESYPSINFEKTSLTFTSNASSQTVKLNTPTNIQLVDKPEWCSVRTSSDSIVVSVIENYCASQRTGNVIFENSVGKATLKVKQKASSSPLFEKGLGTVNDPYQINSAQQLENITKSLDSHFVLTEDIDLKSYLYEYGNGWEPISNFTGSLDGKGHTITGLWIKRPNTDNIGLFGQISNATISNLKVDIDDLGITGRILVGAIAAYANNACLSKCFVNGNVTGHSSVGGLCGASSGVIESCYVYGTITSQDGHIGGLCGTYYGSIENCSVKGIINAGVSSYSSGITGAIGGLCGYCDGNINNSSVSCTLTTTVTGTGNIDIGGICGYYSGNIKNCSSINNILLSGSGTHHAGGLCGSTRGTSTIQESMTEGSIAAQNYASGIVGYVYNGTCSVLNCYSTARLSSTNCDGISIGGNHSRCYYAGEVSCQRFSCGGTYTYFDTTVSGQSGSNGYSTEDMMKQATYESWDFKKIWKITEGKTYPTLRCFDK